MEFWLFNYKTTYCFSPLLITPTDFPRRYGWKCPSARLLMISPGLPPLSRYVGFSTCLQGTLNVSAAFHFFSLGPLMAKCIDFQILWVVKLHCALCNATKFPYFHLGNTAVFLVLRHPTKYFLLVIFSACIIRKV